MGLYLKQLVAFATIMLLPLNLISQSGSSKVAIQVKAGINALSTSLESSNYFINYDPTTESSVFFATDAVIRFSDAMSFKSGIMFLKHNSQTDFLEIPPTRQADISSTFTFDYKSVNVPLAVIYQFNLGSIISIEPSAGIVLRFTSAHNYNEIVTVPPPTPSFNEEVNAAQLSSYETFGVGLLGGLALALDVRARIKPTVNIDYLLTSGNVKVLRGWRPDSSGANLGATIHDKGFLFSVGLRYNL